MMHNMVWMSSEIPGDVLDLAIDEFIAAEDQHLTDSPITGDAKYAHKRNSKQFWIPEFHWFNGFVGHFKNIANRNFMYDLDDNIHKGAVQYTRYSVGDKFDWHEDQKQSDKDDPEIRKLAFSIQLSDEDEYEGGELQFWHCTDTFFAPKRKGTIIFFDARLIHRVRKVKSGTRRALVGWYGGPPWK